MRDAVLPVAVRAAFAAHSVGSSAQQLNDLIRRQGPIEVEALEFVAGVTAHKVGLLLRLDTLRNDGEAERPPHRDDGLGEILIARHVRDVANERAVDLDRVEWKSLEARQ